MELAELNALPAPHFAATLGAIFEHSPWVAERAAAARPFNSRVELLEAMREVVEQGSAEEQMALIRAHPRLGLRGRGRGQMTQASATEQRRAGLDGCTSADFAQLDELNAAYMHKFSMPFILAVRGHDPASIIANLRRRITHSQSAERAAALTEIGLIAGFRLADSVVARAGAEIAAMNDRLARCTASLDGQGQASVWVREWMLAAGLDVSAGDGHVVGCKHRESEPTVGGGGNRSRLLLGVHYDAALDAVRYEGRLGYLLALAVMQLPNIRAARLPFDVLVVARPENPQDEGFKTVALDADVLRSCVALDSLSGAALASGEARALLAVLRTLHLAEGTLLFSRQGPTSVYRPEVPCDVMLDHEARKLGHSLQTECNPTSHG
jgi:OHCU decarboxylase